MKRGSTGYLGGLEDVDVQYFNQEEFGLDLRVLQKLMFMGCIGIKASEELGSITNQNYVQINPDIMADLPHGPNLFKETGLRAHSNKDPWPVIVVFMERESRGDRRNRGPNSGLLVRNFT